MTSLYINRESGNDDFPGTVGLPLRTMQRARQMIEAFPSDSSWICLARGQEFLRPGKFDGGVWLRAYGPPDAPPPVVVSPDGQAAWNFGPRGFDSAGVDFRNDAADLTVAGGIECFRTHARTPCRISDATIVGFAIGVSLQPERPFMLLLPELDHVRVINGRGSTFAAGYVLGTDECRNVVNAQLIGCLAYNISARDAAPNRVQAVYANSAPGTALKDCSFLGVGGHGWQLRDGGAADGCLVARAGVGGSVASVQPGDSGVMHRCVGLDLHAPAWGFSADHSSRAHIVRNVLARTVGAGPALMVEREPDPRWPGTSSATFGGNAVAPSWGGPTTNEGPQHPLIRMFANRSWRGRPSFARSFEDVLNRWHDADGSAAADPPEPDDYPAAVDGVCADLDSLDPVRVRAAAIAIRKVHAAYMAWRELAVPFDTAPSPPVLNTER